MIKATPPLDGLLVIALEHAIAAPLCTRQLAELGARVIKIERREQGDFARHYDNRVKGLCSHFVWTNRSKESLTLDLKHPAAADADKSMATGALHQLHHAIGSGSVARAVLKQLEAVGVVEKGPKGRRITPSGQRDLDRIAAMLSKLGGRGYK